MDIRDRMMNVKLELHNAEADSEDKIEGIANREREHVARDLSACTPTPVENRLRARINKFLQGYGLTPMGRAVALNWIQVCARA